MAGLIEMPKLSDSMTHGKVLNWFVGEGDPVSKGMAVAEVESDKAVLELECTETGVLRAFAAEVNQSVPVGAPLAVVAGRDEDITELLAQLKNAGGAGSKAAAPPAAPPEPIDRETRGERGGRVFISPAAARVAAGHGVDIRGLEGTGPGGRIILRDVNAWLDSRADAAPDTAGEGGFEDIPLSSTQAAMARRLCESKGPVPHFYVEMEADAAALLDAKASLQELAGDIKLTLTDFLIKACALALARNPELNARFLGDAVRRFKSVHIGVAVSSGRGLAVPVIRDCGTKPLTDIARGRAALVDKARGGRLAPADMEGATFTLSNLGMMGVTRFQAVIDPPQAAILAAGAIGDEPVLRGGQWTVGKRICLTLSADHRAADGAVAARFLGDIKRLLETPAALAL